MNILQFKFRMMIILVLCSILYIPALIASATSNKTVAPATIVVSPNKTNDVTIKSNVQMKMKQQSTLTGSSISVSSQQGVVNLSGTAATQEQANAALSAARSVQGVKTVRSNISVTPNSHK